MKKTAAPTSSDTTQPSAIRRFVTLMFSDLNESTRLGASMEAEHYAALVNSLRDAYLAIIPRHGGTVVRIQGDGVLAIFGHPEALEDDGRRATEAALDLHATVRRLRLDPPVPAPARLTLHTGIHAGLVLLGRGDIERGRFELMGNAPNIAARLSDRAEPDEILVSEETLGADRHFFVTGEPLELQIQGTRAPLTALRVVERAGLDNRYEARMRRGLSPFVGRVGELTRLEQSLQAMLAGHTQRVAIAAPPGMGKTRLAHEFLHRCAEIGCRVLRGHCESYTGAQPLQPFLHILRTLFGLEHGLLAAVIAQRVDAAIAAISPRLQDHRVALLGALSVPDPTGVAPRPSSYTTLAALVRLIDALASQGPLVLFLDDWQWADDASHQVLNALHQHPDRRLLILLATREAAAGKASWIDAPSSLDLLPLSAAEAEQAAHRLVPGANPFLLDQICAYSGGNPLYIEELCHRVADDRSGQSLGRLQGGAAWLRVLIEARVTRLPQAQVAIVRSAAMIGNVIPKWLFHRITGCRADDEEIRALAAQDLIYEGEQPGTLRFKHGITRDVVYEAVGLHQRRALHLQIADVLIEAMGDAPAAREDLFEALAYHFGAAGRPSEAAHYAELSGNKALAVSALDRAQSQYRAALAALDELETTPERARRWIDIMQRLGLACVFDPARDDLPLFERALALARHLGDLSAIARALYWLAYLRYALGHSEQAVLDADAAMHAARAGSDDKLAVQVEAMLGQALVATARYAEARPLLDRAIAVKQQHRSGTGLAVGLAYSLACKGHALADHGNFVVARRHFDEALALVGSTEHEIGASVRGLYAVCLLWQGCWAEALATATEGMQIGERVRSLFSMSMSRAAAAYATWKIDADEQALLDMLDTEAWLAPRGNWLFTSLNHGWLADAYASAGRTAHARLYTARALRRGRQGDWIGVAMACRAMARLEARAGRAERARRWVDRAFAIGVKRDSAHERAVTLWCSAQVELAFDQPESAEALLEQAVAAVASLGMTGHLEQVPGSSASINSFVQSAIV